jgi:hypothetical protein
MYRYILGMYWYEHFRRVSSRVSGFQMHRPAAYPRRARRREHSPARVVARSPHPRRSAGARRRGRGTCPRLVARTTALRPGPGPGPGRALRSAARPGAAPVPCPLYEPAAGPSWARPVLSRDLRLRGARAAPAGSLRRRRRAGGLRDSRGGAGGT